MTWDPIRFPCDYIILADQRSPGLAEVVGAGSPRQWDERQGYGTTGARSIFKYKKLVRFSVKIKLYTAGDFALWDEWKESVLKIPKRGKGQLDIWHPLLEELDIKSVGVEDVSQAEQTDDGEWTYTIKFLEHRDPKLTLVKPEGSAATPVDPVDKYIEELTKQVQELAK